MSETGNQVQIGSDGDTHTPRDSKMDATHAGLGGGMGTNGNGHSPPPSPRSFGVKESRPGRKVDVHLWWPTHDTRIKVRTRLALDGWYRDERAKIHVPLHPRWAMNQGREVHIDAERGVQIRYEGLRGWVGMDGRYAMAANVGRDAQELQAARAPNRDKQFMWMAICVCGAIAGLVLALGIIAGK